MALAAFESHVTHESVDSIIARRYPDNLEADGLRPREQEHREPGDDHVQGWAAELVREGYGAFMEALQAESIVPRIPMQRYTFDNFAKIKLPMRNDMGSKPNLAAAFRAEGAPIRVGRTTLLTKELTPKTMGVIGTFTKELLQRSTPNIEDAIRRWMLEDTPLALDVTYLDNVAGTTIRPASIQYGIAPGDTAASTGNTALDIANDIRACLVLM